MQTAWWGADPVGLFDRCAERYGDTFTVKFGYRGQVVCVCGAEGLRELFMGGSTFHAGNAYEVLEPVAGQSSPLVLDGDEHLRMRRLILPPLHGEALRHWESTIAEMTNRAIASWPRREAFSLRTSMEQITLEVIMRIVFGIRDPRRAEELRRLLPHMFEIGPLLGIHFLFPALRRDLGALSPWGKFLRRRSRIDELLYEEISARRLRARGAALQAWARSTGRPHHAPADRNRRWPPDVRRASSARMLITLLLAGQETTATALAWAFERLAQTCRRD